MKILFVAMAESVHTTRWISQINDQGWEIHICPSTYSSSIYRQIKNTTIHYSNFSKKAEKTAVYHIKGPHLWLNRFITGLKFYRDKIDKNARSRQLNNLIKKIKPDIVHSLEFQSAGYLVLKAKSLFQGKFPIWIATNWGSDIYWFRHFPIERIKIEETLKKCDYYSCECKRDVELAEHHGLKGEILPILPGPGGLDLKKIKSWRKPLAQRKIIMLKGYHGIWGRVLVGLDALKLCADQLKNYTIVVYSILPQPSIIEILSEFKKQTGLKVKIISHNVSHEQILKLHGQARISISLSISDGLSNSFLESMVMGSFPIQSNTACADEWVKNGKTGILVPSEDSKVVAEAIKKVIHNDKLLEEAAKINWQTAEKRLDYQLIKTKTLEIYKKIQKDLRKKQIAKSEINLSKSNYRNLVEHFLFFWIIFWLVAWLMIGLINSVKDSGVVYPSKIQKFIVQTDQFLKTNKITNLYIYKAFN